MGLKMTKNIVLIGMMGSGKTLIAKALARKLNLPLASTDQDVERKAGCAIKELVSKQGWASFRAIEKDVVRDLSGRIGSIIDCGGGVVLDPENMDLLRKNGILFYLDASLEVLYQRLKDDPHRPLIQVADPLAELTKIYKQRSPLYNQADHRIDANDPAIDSPITQILLKV